MYNLLKFDGSFIGFLSLLHYAKMHKITPQNIITPHTPLSLFDEPVFVENNKVKSEQYYQYLQQKMPKFALQNFCYGFLYDDKPIYLQLFNYLNLQNNALKDSAFEPVKSVEKASKYVRKERHRMLGFIRFSKLNNGIFYAQMEPKSNVLVLLGNHFKQRLLDEWIIHDTKRSLALLHNHGQLSIKQVDKFDTPSFAKEELACKELWKKFFTSISINSRKNYKTQRGYVPLFYRAFMDEFL